MKKFFQTLFMFIGIIVVGGLIMMAGTCSMMVGPMMEDERLSKNSILALDLTGIIEDEEKFLEKLRKYRDDKHIKGILVRVDSPGGMVGPSQEIYDELRRTRDELKKPVVAVCASVMASGAYYAAAGASKIVTTPGCIMGSIGVIMHFANLEKLYDWARVQRYSLKTGPFKDSGSDYRAMNPEEKALLQGMLDQVLGQFKQAIHEGRKMTLEQVSRYADGRIFSGAWGVENGFADQIGNWEDARRLVGELSGLGKDPEIFKPRLKSSRLRAILEEEDSSSHIEKFIANVFHSRLMGQPLYILPGALGL